VLFEGGEGEGEGGGGGGEGGEKITMRRKKRRKRDDEEEELKLWPPSTAPGQQNKKTRWSESEESGSFHRGAMIATCMGLFAPDVIVASPGGEDICMSRSTTFISSKNPKSL